MIKQPKVKVKASPKPIEEPLDEWWRDDPDYLESLKTLTCFDCGRGLPNTLRMHAHLQMHRESKKRRKSKDEDVIDQLDGANDTNDLDQVDGANDLVVEST